MINKLTSIFTSPQKMNEEADSALMAGIKSQFPIENKDYKLELRNISVAKKEYDVNDEKDAILKSKSLTYLIRGDLVLIDKASGKVIDSEHNVPLSDTFFITDKHTLIYKGNNYTIANQLQLLPGAYTRSRNTGELETHFNTGTGRSFSITLEPQTGLFYLEVATSRIPLAPLIANVFEIAPKSVGRYIPMELWENNIKSFAGKENKAVSDMYQRMVSTRLQKKNISYEETVQTLKASLESSQLHEKTTDLTLGKSFSSVQAEALLLAMKNLVDVYTGKREEDNRDSLQFKRVQNLPDYLYRRFEKEHASVTKIKDKLLFNLSRVKTKPPKIRDFVPTKPFNKVYSSYILTSPLVATPSETNPIESWENVGKVTVLGADEGGIGEERGVPMSARNIDPSHLGIIDPSRTPESSHAGIDQRFTISAKRDREGNLYSEVVDNLGKTHYLSVPEMMKTIIGFPGQKGRAKVQAQAYGQLVEVNAKDVRYWIPSATNLYTITTNLVPFLNSNHPGRLTMAGKAIPQALSLVNREVPLVQTVFKGDKTFVEALGEEISRVSKVNGVVTSVDHDVVVIKDSEGKLHKIKPVRNLPFNMKGFLDDEHPIVTVGEKVKQGQPLFDNNYTKKGILSLGKNLTAAYIPWKGYNHEDGLVLSRAAADSLSSHHSYKIDYDVTSDAVMKKSFISRYFPGKFTKDQLDKLDERGFAKIGVRLDHGDPAYAVLEKRIPSPEEIALGKLHKSLVNPYRLVVEYWTHTESGKVIDAHTEGKYIRILVRSIKPLDIGDKLTGLHGNKGVVSLILENNKMPYNKDTGEPLDILLNPASVTSRINLGQLAETAAAKIAKKTGKPYKVTNFGNDSNLETLMSELKKHGLKDTNEIVDPTTNKSFGQILSGPQYFLKLYKTTDSNYSARNIGGYDSTFQPTKGGEEGSKSVGWMEALGLLGSNARANMREMITTKSEQNDEFWKRFASGQPLPKPKMTFATQKFFDYLKGSGINVNMTDTHIQARPMTDHDIIHMSNGEVKEPLMLSAKNLTPERGGLFDPAITGGIHGQKWSHYRLAEPIVNPVFERAVKSVLGLSSGEFNGLVQGTVGVKKHLKDEFHIHDIATGKVLNKIKLTKGLTEEEEELEKEEDETHTKLSSETVQDKIKTGGEGFKELLSNVNVTNQIRTLLEDIRTTRSVSKKDAMIKKLKYLHGLKEMGMKPEEAYIISHMPVIPPISRPLIIQGGNRIEHSDVSMLYKDHMLINNSLKDIVDLLPPEALVTERKALYDGAKAVMGLGEAVSGASRGRGLKGLLQQISGTSGPKTGFFHSKLLSKKQDFSGRATIYAEPNLKFNEAAIPKDMLWTMGKLHIIRDLVKNGYDRISAEKAWVDRSTAAVNSFNKFIKEVPVILNRAPTLMKSNITAHWAVPVEGQTIGINPLHLPLYAGDYDGDAFTVHLPMTPEAVSEARSKLLPQHHIHDYRKGLGVSMMAPQHEAVLGGVYMTEPDMKQKTVNFKTEQEALYALERGDIQENTPITIG
jgi:DNA-directed RNA polymerase beta subunit